MRYVIADIEATGLEADRQMIELALITFENGKVTDVFETLLNPLVPVSKFITDFTLINPRQIENAPKFYEVAERVQLRLEGAVFVSHKVEFDWPMLRDAFEQMGRPLKCKTLCTLKLSQELVPGLKSYALEDLCKFFHVKMKERHRALPDALATLELFKELKSLAAGKGTSGPRYLPHHESQLKKLPRRAGVLYCKDAKGIAFHIEATGDLSETALKLFAVRPEARDLLTRCEEIHFEVTGSELIAQFKKARFVPVRWQWMVRVSEINGEKYFQLAEFKAQDAIWVFQTRQEAAKALRDLNKKLPKEEFAWREGGKTKQEIIEHNRVIDDIVREASFPCENLLFWGPGPTPELWSYVLVRQGRLWGHGTDPRHPDQVILDPESAVTRKQDKNLELLAIRYLREHRQKRHKVEAWRELKGTP
ncbi:MAG: PolC-type DNA polymerase III [Bacteriovoracia bacterium]